MSYFYFEDSVKKTVENTPEGLRAAAKLLEEEAKKLDEPKLTPKQKRYMEKNIGSTDFALYKDGYFNTFTLFTSSSWDMSAKKFAVKDAEAWLRSKWNLIKAEEVVKSPMWIDGDSVPVLTINGVTYIDWYNL